MPDELRTREGRGRDRGALTFGKAEPGGRAAASNDTLAPVLSGQTVGTVTATTGIPAVDTTEGNGRIYMVVVPDADTPSILQIKAGRQSNGTAALGGSNQAVVQPGTQTFAVVTGLITATAYDVWFVHTDIANNNSTAVKADLTTA